MEIVIASYNTSCAMTGKLIKKGDCCYTDGNKHYFHIEAILPDEAEIKPQRRLKFIGRRVKK